MAVTVGSGSAAAQNLRVVPVPWVASDPTIPHHAYNGHPTTFKAIARGGNGTYTYEWDFNGDGVFDSNMQTANRYDLSASYQLHPQVVTTTFVATIRVSSNGETVTGTYPVRQFADVPVEPLFASERALQIMRSVAVDDGLWYLHTQMVRAGDEANPLTGAQITGTVGAWPAASVPAFLWALSINGHGPAWPTAYIGTLPDAAKNAQRFRDDPYAEDAARLLNFLLAQAFVITSVPSADEDNRVGFYPEITAPPIAGTDDGVGLFIGTDQDRLYYMGHAVAALAVSDLQGYVAQVGEPERVLGRRMEHVLQQLVDGLVWAQNDDAGFAGSWSYDPNATRDDLSITLWAMTGLWCADVFARDQGVIVPNRVKARLLGYIQRNRHACQGGGVGGSYGSAVANRCDHALTAGHLLALGWVQANQFAATDPRIAFPGHSAITRGDLRTWFDGVVAYVAVEPFGVGQSTTTGRNTGAVEAGDFNRRDGRGNHYDMLHWQDAARAVEPEVVTFGNRDWNRLFSTYFVNNQAASGGWNWTFGSGVQSRSDETAGPVLRAAWAILVLSPDAIPPLSVGTASMTTAPEGTPIDFDGSASDPGTGNPVYVWTFGNGAMANGKNVTYAYPDNGTFDATLTSTSIGGVSVETIPMTITNVAPVTGAGPDRVIHEGTALPMAMTFTDPGTADTWTFLWDFADTTTGNAQAMAHMWADNGVFNVTARVTDDDGGTSTDVAVVTVDNVAPTITSTPPTVAQEAHPYTYTLTFTDPGTADTHTCSAPVRPAGSILVGCQLAWTPDFAQAIGAAPPVWMCVTDDDGGQACQDYTIDVSFLDSDGDGLPDAWEISHFGDITSQDQFGDPDADGMLNLQEFTYVTDPLTYDGPSAPVPNAPMCGSQIASLQTALVVNNAVDPQGAALRYQFQLFRDVGLTILIAETQYPQQLVPEGAGTTSWPAPVTMLENTRYFWRARALDPFTFGPYLQPACSFFVNTTNEAPGIPRINSPAFGAQVNTFTPTLRVDNATDPDEDALHYQFEVYRDAGLSVPIAQTAAAGVAEGGGGVTSWQADNANPALVEDHVYYWRARACDPDALCGGWSASGQFFVSTTNAPPEPPSIVSPRNGSIVADRRPGLVVLNANDADLDALVYDWDLARDVQFGAIVQSGVNEPPVGAQNTTFALVADLAEDTRYCWRVRSDDGQATSVYNVACFLVSERNDPPSAPVLINPSDGQTVATPTPVFAWAPSIDPEDEPMTYELEVRDGDGTVLGSANYVSGTVTSIAGTLVNGGRYTWRVRATDRAGASSDWSEDNAFSVGAPSDDPQIEVSGGACDSSGQPGTGWIVLVLVIVGSRFRARRRRDGR